MAVWEDEMKYLRLKSRALAQVLALIGFFGLFALASMTVIDIGMRWLFSMPIQGVNDVSSVVMAVVIASCVPANLAFKQNIRVEMFGAAAGPRIESILEAFASFLTLVFIILISWQFVPYAAGLKVSGDTTWVLHWPVWPWWTVAALMLFIAALVQLVVFLDDLLWAFKGIPAPIGN
jgi:TRAP-type transport system small permease protein